MAEPEKKDEKALTKEEFYAMLLKDCGVDWEEGRDLYMDEMIAQIRTELGEDAPAPEKTDGRRKPAGKS